MVTRYFELPNRTQILKLWRSSVESTATGEYVEIASTRAIRDAFLVRQASSLSAAMEYMNSITDFSIEWEERTPNAPQQLQPTSPPLPVWDSIIPSEPVASTVAGSGWTTNSNTVLFAGDINTAYNQLYNQSRSLRANRYYDPNEVPEMPVRKGSKKLSPLWKLYHELKSFSATVEETYQKEGYQKKPEDDIIGIEFENELPSGVSAPENKHFRVSGDNSLRGNGVEWVLYEPSKITSVKKWYTELLSDVKKVKANNSERASTHVHFDVTKMSYLQVLTFAMSYFFVEELLSHFAGASRQNNLFCLRLVDSKRTVFDLAQELTTRQPFSCGLFTDTLRYSALNFSAVSKFGSLEFRMFPAVSEPDNLNVWVDALNNIRLFSLKFKTLHDLNEYLIKENASEVIPAMLGEAELKYILDKIKRKSLDSEVLSWSRSAYCTIAPIFYAGKTIPTEEEIEKALKEAEIDEKKLAALNKAETEKKKAAKASVYTYPVVFGDSEIQDQMRQMTQAGLAGTIETQREL